MKLFMRNSLIGAKLRNKCMLLVLKNDFRKDGVVLIERTRNKFLQSLHGEYNIVV